MNKQARIKGKRVIYTKTIQQGRRLGAERLMGVIKTMGQNWGGQEMVVQFIKCYISRKFIDSYNYSSRIKTFFFKCRIVKWIHTDLESS